MTAFVEGCRETRLAVIELLSVVEAEHEVGSWATWARSWRSQFFTDDAQRDTTACFALLREWAQIEAVPGSFDGLVPAAEKEARFLCGEIEKLALLAPRGATS